MIEVKVPTFIRKTLKSGFTMIELLMVIMIVAILGAVALPQFLDFRKEARRSAIQSSLNSWKSGIKNQIQQAMLRCSKSVGWVPGYQLLTNNDMTFNVSYGCTTTQLPNVPDRKFVDQLPKNPYTGTNTLCVNGNNFAGPYNSTSVCDEASYIAGSDSTCGWGYITFNGARSDTVIFAATTIDGACAIS